LIRNVCIYERKLAKVTRWLSISPVGIFAL